MSGQKQCGDKYVLSFFFTYIIVICSIFIFYGFKEQFPKPWELFGPVSETIFASTVAFVLSVIVDRYDNNQEQFRGFVYLICYLFTGLAFSAIPTKIVTNFGSIDIGAIIIIVVSIGYALAITIIAKRSHEVRSYNRASA